METHVNSNVQMQNRSLLMALSLFFGLIGLVGIIIHFSPDALMRMLSDFAHHHYLMFGMGCGVVAILLNQYCQNLPRKFQMPRNGRLSLFKKPIRKIKQG